MYSHEDKDSDLSTLVKPGMAVAAIIPVLGRPDRSSLATLAEGVSSGFSERS